MSDRPFNIDGGQTLVERNWQALAATCEALVQVPLQALDPASHQRPRSAPRATSDLVIGDPDRAPQGPG